MPKLTKRCVDALLARSKDTFVWDDELKGFGVRVLTSGRKTFLAQYRSGGVQRRVKLGVYGAITADQARSAARQVLGDVAGGENPAEDIRTYRMAPTMASVCERFFDEHARVRCKPSTQYEYRRAIKHHIKPAFGPRKIADITRADVAKLHHDLRHIPYQANRVIGVLSKMFNLAEVWGLRPDGSNPCRHVRKYREHHRERFLSPQELTHLGTVLDQLEAEEMESRSAIAAIRLLILTGCRLKEIQTLKWATIDGNHINLPDSKTGARRIPISPAVRQTLDALPRLPGNPYVIVGTVPGQHLTDLQRPWRRIRKKVGLTDVRIHDLRHTFASNALTNGVPIEMVGKLLGHTQLQTTMRYAHLADDPVRAAATEVSNALSGYLTAGMPQGPDTPTDPTPASKVVRFPKA
jgi:integrase